MLEMAAAAGEIDLLYGDESGFCLWSAVVYGYFFRGEQKRQEQTARRGKRLSVMGLLQPLVGFVFSFALGSFRSQDFIEMMEHQAKIAEENLKKFSRIRVITVDNGSIHTSKVVKAKIAEWESRGLFLFFLPPYCSEMNTIELEWEHLKRGEIKGEMFESEAQLAYHVLEGIEARGEANGHQVEYVNLRSTSKPAE
jgi:transposase